MRFAVLLSLFTASCGLKQMAPEGPVLDAWDRTQQFPGDAPSGVQYRGEPRVPFPVPPFQVFGAVYDLDVVIVSTNPEWDMHEYAMLRTPTGPLWLALDTRKASMAQSVVADLPDIDAWMPEIPLERRASAVVVEDRSTEDRVDLSVSYENIDGQPVVATYEGKPPAKLKKKRNGSSMQHSRDQVLAVLDLSHLQLGKKSSITIGGEEWPTRRLLGVIPFRMVLKQAQGGLVVADVKLSSGGAWSPEPSDPETLGAYPLEAIDAGATDSGVASRLFSTTYSKPDGSDVRTRWEMVEGDGWVDVRQVSDLRTLVYRYRVDGGSWELWWAEVRQWGQSAPTTHVEVHPCLPDLRRPFEGRWQGRFVIDVNGQQNHAVGTVEAWWEGDQAHVRVLPSDPWWAAARPLETVVSYATGTAQAKTTRIAAP